MRLGEYLAGRGLLPMQAAAASNQSVIRAFLFGEEYTVELALDGAVSSYRFDTLDEALDVLQGEFDRAPKFLPEIQIVDYSKTRNAKFGLAPAVGNEKPNVKVAALKDDQLDALRYMMQGLQQVPTFGPAASRVLAVTFAERNMAFPAPPVEFYAEEVREAVTYFSLTGTWDQMDGRTNL